MQMYIEGNEVPIRTVRIFHSKPLLFWIAFIRGETPRAFLTGLVKRLPTLFCPIHAVILHSAVGLLPHSLRRCWCSWEPTPAHYLPIAARTIAPTSACYLPAAARLSRIRRAALYQPLAWSPGRERPLYRHLVTCLGYMKTAGGILHHVSHQP